MSENVMKELNAATIALFKAKSNPKTPKEEVERLEKEFRKAEAKLLH